MEYTVGYLTQLPYADTNWESVHPWMSPFCIHQSVDEIYCAYRDCIGKWPYQWACYLEQWFIRYLDGYMSGMRYVESLFIAEQKKGLLIHALLVVRKAGGKPRREVQARVHKFIYQQVRKQGRKNCLELSFLQVRGAYACGLLESLRKYIGESVTLPTSCCYDYVKHLVVKIQHPKTHRFVDSLSHFHGWPSRERDATLKKLYLTILLQYYLNTK